MRCARLLPIVCLGIGMGAACGGSDGRPDDDYGAVQRKDGGDAHDDGGDSDSAQAPSSVPPPIGTAAFSAVAFERLPFLRAATRARKESSYDRSGGNADMSIPTNFLYRDANGDKVLVDTEGPGCVHRIWFTGFDASQHLRFYFDGESTPRIDTTLGAFFRGDQAPLVGDETVSSGGFYSYVPLPFAKSLKVTASGNGPDYYYHFDYHLFDPNIAVSSWTGKEDLSAAKALWTAAGSDPKPAHADGISAEGSFDLAAGATRTLLDVDGPRQIDAILLSVPSALPVTPVSYTDDGRAFVGESTFKLKIDPQNEGVVLVRRLDYGIADQSAQIFVDGQPAGTWSDAGSDADKQFRDRSFALPARLTRGKSSIVIRVVRQSSGLDWNEFYYWAYSRVRGADVVTDELDVGKAASEGAHDYTLTNQTFAGSRTYDYPAPHALARALDDLWIRIAWDGAAKPHVEAPVGSFFALGEYGPARVKGLAAGMHADGVMYLYFPMPFAKHAKIELLNRGTGNARGLWFEARHHPFTDSFNPVGYFATAFHAATPSTSGVDLSMLEASGRGHVVGIVQSENGPKIRGYLEGDDRVLVDDRRTPLHGTGTEDIYTGGFYFSRGPYSLPLNGNPSHYVEGEDDGTSAYRFFFPDLLPFRKNIRFTVEHGPVDDIAVNAWTLSYYYTQPNLRLVSSDTLKVGDPADEAKHGYAIDGATYSGSRSYTFEGEDDRTEVTLSGRAHKGESRFVLAVDPNNDGVVLRRVFDQHIGRQRARVFVDDVAVGDFYYAGANGSHAWREEELAIPPELTQSKRSLRVRVQFVSSDADFNEFEYGAFSILP